MKKQSATTEIKKIFESTLNKEKTDIDVPPTIKEILESQMDKCNINILKKEIKTANACFWKFFLYDLENMINKIYVTQLNKEF